MNKDVNCSLQTLSEIHFSLSFRNAAVLYVSLQQGTRKSGVNSRAGLQVLFARAYCFRSFVSPKKAFVTQWRKWIVFRAHCLTSPSIST